MLRFLQREKLLVQQSRELQRLREEVHALRQQNESMRVGMRRCISCDYRLQARANDAVGDHSEPSA